MPTLGLSESNNVDVKKELTELRSTVFSGGTYLISKRGSTAFEGSPAFGSFLLGLPFGVDEGPFCGV